MNIGAVPGSHTFTFTTYDQVGSAGNKLSVNSVVQTLYWDQVNPVNVTLAGVPKAVQVAPLPSATGISGNSSSGLQFLFGSPRSISVAAIDSDGNYIVGPGAPTLSVSVTGATAAANMTASAASDGNPNHYLLNATSSGTGSLAITATPTSALAGTSISSTVSLTSEVIVTFVDPMTSGGSMFVDGVVGTERIAPNAKGITYDSADGNLYITDSLVCTVRQVTLSGTITSYAGGLPPVTNKCNGLDGTGATTSGPPGFYTPEGIVYDPATSSFYVADYGNCKIRQISGVGAVVTTLAGAQGACGTNDGQGNAAQFNGPMDITYDSNNGNLYEVDVFGCSVRQITPLGAVTTIAGNNGCNGTVSDGTGGAAHFNGPWGITYDSFDHNLYVADTGSCAIRKVTPAGVVTTLAGSLPAGGTAACLSTDGTGSAAQFNMPYGITYDSNDGNLYVTTYPAQALRQVTPAGVVTTLVSGSNVPALVVGNPSYLDAPLSLTFDPNNGFLYILDNDSIRQVQL